MLGRYMEEHRSLATWKPYICLYNLIEPPNKENNTVLFQKLIFIHFLTSNVTVQRFKELFNIREIRD
jgi:hypothetical protein